MKLIVLRHGRTQANEDDLYVGAHLDLPLSKNGRYDARTCGCVENVQTVYVSPMLRARETARICFPAAQQVPIETLREMDFGMFEGRSPKSMENDPEYRAWVDSWCTARCPGGETRDEFTQRVAAAISQLLIDARKTPAEHIIVIAHSGTVLATMETFAKQHSKTEEEDTYFSWLVGNGEGRYADVKFNENGQPYLIHPKHFDSLEFMQ